MGRDVQEIAEKRVLFLLGEAGDAALAGTAGDALHEDFGIFCGAGIFGGAGAFQVEIELEGFDGVVLAHLVAFKQGGRLPPGLPHATDPLERHDKIIRANRNKPF
jgi:hypothetical protein